MVDLKRINFIIGKSQAITFGLSKILDFLELEGRNIIFLCKPINEVKTSLRYILSYNQIEFKNEVEFSDLLQKKSTLFRVDLIVVDLWEEDIDSLINYKEFLDRTGLDYIIISDKCQYIIGDEEITVYRIEQERSESNIKSIRSYDTKYYIKNEITNESYSFDDFKTSYIRDKKIDDIFKKK